MVWIVSVASPLRLGEDQVTLSQLTVYGSCVVARSARLLRLLQAMRVMDQPITAACLAQETEVSHRSLYRDIDSLRAVGVQIEGERGYG
ncbi:HTH domain-containing protein [Pseudoroseomonas ludipueritiae]|uniref:HTH domain-containing protein n=1 Tax=Pseudoroseomonas ludipueritiae TaxID=198093 RepID=UPI002AA52BDB